MHIGLPLLSLFSMIATWPNAFHHSVEWCRPPPRVLGITRNPWNAALSAGGSSGGSAAALAVGSTWLATGVHVACGMWHVCMCHARVLLPCTFVTMFVA